MPLYISFYYQRYRQSQAHFDFYLVGKKHTTWHDLNLDAPYPKAYLNNDDNQRAVDSVNVYDNQSRFSGVHDARYTCVTHLSLSIRLYAASSPL